MDQRQLFQFQSHQDFFGGARKCTLTTVKLGLDGKKLKKDVAAAATVVVPAVNGLESQLGDRPELAGNETISQPAAEAAFGNCPQTSSVHKLQKELPGEAASIDFRNHSESNCWEAILRS